MPMRDMGTNGSNGRQFFTAKEAAAHCGVSIWTLYRLVKTPRSKGGPPFKRFGVVFRFPKAKFIAWAENEEMPR